MKKRIPLRKNKRIKKDYIVWNKGLIKETDKRILKYSRTLSKINTGKRHLLKTRILMSINRKGKVNLNEKNGMWKGNNVGYCAVHIWIKNHKSKPKYCENCNKKEPYDLANISGKYKRDINDYRWLCRSCHMKEDGRILNLLYQK